MHTGVTQSQSKETRLGDTKKVNNGNVRLSRMRLATPWGLRCLRRPTRHPRSVRIVGVKRGDSANHVRQTASTCRCGSTRVPHNQRRYHSLGTFSTAMPTFAIFPLLWSDFPLRSICPGTSPFLFVDQSIHLSAHFEAHHRSLIPALPIHTMSHPSVTLFFKSVLGAKFLTFLQKKKKTLLHCIPSRSDPSSWPARRASRPSTPSPACTHQAGQHTAKWCTMAPC